MNKVPVTQSSPKSSFIPLCAFILPYGASGSSELHSIVRTFSCAYVCRLPIHLCIHEAPSLISQHIFHQPFLSHSIHWFIFALMFLISACLCLSLSLSLLLWAFSCHPLSSHLPLSIAVTFYLSFSLSRSSAPILSLLFQSHVPGLFPGIGPGLIPHYWDWCTGGLGAIAIAGCG